MIVGKNFLLINLFLIVFILVSGMIDLTKQQENDQEFGKRLNNRSKISLSSYYRRKRYQQHLNNQNNYHQHPDLIVSESKNVYNDNINQKRKGKIFLKTKIRRLPLFIDNGDDYNNNNNNNNTNSNNVTSEKSWSNNINSSEIDKEMVHIIDSFITNVNNSNSNNNNSNRSDDNNNNNNNNNNTDQSTSESLYSNQYVIVDGHDLHHHNQLLLQQQQQQQHQQMDDEKISRQPILVDNLMAMSTNELPPLTAALPMQYLNDQHHQHQNLLTVNDVNNVASLYSSLPPTTLDKTNDLVLEKSPIILSHYHKVNPLEASLTNHYYDHNPQLIDTATTLYQHDDHHKLLLHNDDYIPGIPGKPWKDYPLYSHVPKTAFHCNGAYGFFADLETKCQVWHYCQLDGRHDSFLCTNGTLFNQMTRTCDWWYNVDCKLSTHYYGINADLYKQDIHHL